MYKDLIKSFDKYGIDAYIIPTSDEYQNEYVPDHNKRLEYITGFTGSNGRVIITRDKGYFFTDGRYTAQAKQELSDFYTIFDLKEEAPLPTGVKVGYNPQLFTNKQLESLRGLDLLYIKDDLIDWKNRPEAFIEKAFIYDLGLNVQSKIALVRDKIRNRSALITDITSICWLLNIRGRDIEFSPLLLSRLVITSDKLILFVDPNKIGQDIRNKLDFITFMEECELESYLKHLDGEVMLDEDSCNIFLQNAINRPLLGPNPIMQFQIIKSSDEIEGAKNAHIQDAIALCRGFSWIEDNIEESISEYDIGAKLSEFRSMGKDYMMDSFPSIVGFKDNGAIIHYRADNNDAKILEGDSMLLIDSGAHYMGGTTDVTRNLYFGTPSDDIKRKYTLVLKGHIAVASYKFSKGTKGARLDIMARKALQDEGYDFAHSTGHGVGNFLSVHEGSMLSRVGPELLPGMILSNEPGYYEEGEYGIRIENLLYIKDLGDNMLAFEDLTLLPYCHALIDFTILNDSEMQYIRDYYVKIESIILPLLEGRAKVWLQEELDQMRRSIV